MSIEKNNFVLSRKKNKNDYNLFERMNDAIAKRFKWEGYQNIEKSHKNVKKNSISNNKLSILAF